MKEMNSNFLKTKPEKPKLTVNLPDSLKNILATLLPYVGLVLVILFFSISTDGKLFSPYNLSIIMQQVTALAIVSLGAVFVYALGEIDVSIGATLGLSTLIIINIINAGYPLIIGFIAALLLALSFGLINGAVSSWLGLPSIVTSLFLMFVGGGIQKLITLKTNTITTSYDFSLWKEAWFQLLMVLIVLLVVGYLFNFTRIGKYIKGIGANSVSTAQSGINIIKYKIIAFLLLGSTVALSSIFVLSRTASTSKATGLGMEMDIMIALILGGMPLAGGMKSRVSPALVGAVIFVLLTNGLTLTGVDITYVPLVKAIILIVIVVITGRKKNGVLPR
jgi:ribose transport system permease protein